MEAYLKVTLICVLIHANVLMKRIKTKLINLLDCHSFEYKISAFNLDLREY